MKMLLITMTAVVLLSACGTPDAGIDINQPSPSSPQPVSSNVQAIDDVVALVNEQRVVQGQDPITQGLTCALYTVPQTTTAIIGAALTTVGSFTFNGTFQVPSSSVTAGFTVLPQVLQGVYQTWFVVKCTGQLIAVEDAWHEFDVTSDDGSNLYVDGLLINNDGLHGAETKAAVKFLAQGTHSFELDFFQGAGQQELILNMDNALLPSAQLYH